MKFIIIFLSLILLIGVLKQYKSYKELYANTITESYTIYNDIELFIDSIKSLLNSIYISLFPNSNTYVEHANQFAASTDLPTDATTTTSSKKDNKELKNIKRELKELSQLINKSNNFKYSELKKFTHLLDHPHIHSSKKKQSNSSLKQPESFLKQPESSLKQHNETSGKHKNETSGKKQNETCEHKHNMGSTLKEQDDIIKNIEHDHLKLIKEMNKYIDNIGNEKKKEKKIRKKRNYDNEYILKTAIKVCPPSTNMNDYVLKKSIMPTNANCIPDTSQPTNSPQTTTNSSVSDTNTPPLSDTSQTTNSQQMGSTSQTTNSQQMDSPSSTSSSSLYSLLDNSSDTNSLPSWSNTFAKVTPNSTVTANCDTLGSKGEISQCKREKDARK
jgi:hypothetical protein